MRIPLTQETPWQTVTRHARLWRRCLALAIVRETQFRAHFVSTILVGVAQVVLGLVPVLVLFDHAETVDGWTRADMIVMLGVFQMMLGLHGFLFSHNMWEITQGVRHGSLDLMLIRPVNAQFYAGTRWVRPEQLFNVIGGVAIVAVGLSQGRGTPSASQLMQMLILMASGLVALGCGSLALAYLSFWITSADSLLFFYGNEVLGAGRYPVGFFPLMVRVFLTVFVPVAFAVTFPAQAITRGIPWWVVLTGVGFAAVAIWLLRRFWNIAIRRYSSASS